MNDRKLFERILVPTQMDDFDRVPLRYALLFNERLGSKLTLLHAEEISWLTAHRPPGYFFEDIAHARGEIELRLSEWANRYAPESVRASTVFADDNPAHAIVATAKEMRADLVIMGTHGRHGWSRVLMGSVAERVLRESDVAVLTVRPDLAPRHGTAIRTVLCPVNFTEVARAALGEAAHVAEALEAQLIVLHVLEEGSRESDRSVESQFGGWVDPLIRNYTWYDRTVVNGDPAIRVLEVAEEMAADLLVIGAQHRRFSDATVIGSTTERITRFAKHPVLTVVRKPVPVSAEGPEMIAAVLGES